MDYIAENTPLYSRNVDGKNSNLLDRCISFSISKYTLADLEHQPHTYKLTMVGEETAMYASGYYDHWCEENCIGRWFKLEEEIYYRYGFEDATDATAFKMYFM